MSDEMKDENCGEDEFSIQYLMILGLALCPGIKSDEAKILYSIV
jgi:hypothetical protein